MSIQEESKKILTACTIGHVDSGKSTMMGSIFENIGVLSNREMAKLANEATTHNKPSFGKAFSCDTLEQERKRGITIVSKSKKVKISDYNGYKFRSEEEKKENQDTTFYFVDCPGHADFIKQMISGASNADVALVLVPATDFAAASSAEGTLRQHILLAGIFGIKRLIVCINKIDCFPEADQKRKFEEIETEMRDNIIPKIHSDKKPIILPISALNNTGISESIATFPWFDGTNAGERGTQPKVKAVMEALFSIPFPVRPTDKPLRVLFTKLCTVSGIGSVFTAVVLSGRLLPNSELLVMPRGSTHIVKSLQIHKTDVPEVLPGEACGITFKTLSKEVASEIIPGSIFCLPNSSPVKMYPAFKANVIVFQHPKGIKVNYTPTLDIAAIGVPAKIVKFIDKRKISEPKPTPMNDGDLVKSKEIATAVIYPLKPIVFEDRTETHQLSRFAMRDGNKVVAFGTILQKLTEDDLAALGIKVDKSGKIGDGKKKK